MCSPGCAPPTPPNPPTLLPRCPLPLNTTAQWLPPWTSWPLCGLEGEGWGGIQIVTLRAPASYSPNKQKDDKAHYSARLDDFGGRDLPQDDPADRWCTKPREQKKKGFMDSSSSPLCIKMNKRCCFSHTRFVLFFASTGEKKRKKGPFCFTELP